MRSVRARLAILFMVMAGILLLCSGVSLYWWVRAGLRKELIDSLETQSGLFRERLLEERAEVRRGVHTEAALTAMMDSFLRLGGGLAMVEDEAGRRVYASPGFSPPAAESHYRLEVRGHVFRGRIYPASSGDDSLTVWFAVDEEPYLRYLARIRWYLAFFYPMLLGAAGLIGWMFVGRALAPVEEIRRQAERISRSNLSERVPLPRSTGEFRNLARTFNEMLDRLDRAFQDLEHFAADAAHELRTPLANLRAELETAVQERRTPEVYERVLASVAEEAARMNRIVSDLFTLARVDMRKYALKREPVALTPLVQDACETWQGVARQRGIGMVVAGEPEAVVSGDPVALRRIFMNLVENAVKYNREGGRVALTLSRIDGHVRVRVEDTGPGIAAEHLPRLFQRFYRVDTSRSRDSGGAGLGLAICKAFVEAHEGRIDVSSAPGEGTAFTVDLPAA